MAEEAALKPVEDAPRSSDDGFRIHPHVFSFASKATKDPDFKKELLRRLKGVGGDSKKDLRHTKFLVEEYAALLTRARLELLSQIRTPAVSDVQPGLEAAFKEYVSLLLGLATYVGAPAGAANQAPGPETAEPSEKALRTSLMRDAVTFEWRDALFGNKDAVFPDALCELVSVVTATAGWNFRRAAYLCKDSRSGVDTQQAVQAYKLLLVAAGYLTYLRDTCAPLLPRGGTSADCTQDAVAALLHTSLADAQAITTLRAMAKNSQPGLVASLALDTEALYRNAVASARSVPSSDPRNKVLAYAEYKAAAFRAYGLCFSGLAQLKEGQGGAAVRLLEQSKVSASESIPLAAAYNKAEPSTPAAEHTEFDHDLRICVDSALARAKRENDNLYYQRPPEVLPALPPAQRMVKATPWALPASHPCLQELTSLDAFAAVPQEVTPEQTPQPGSRAPPPAATASAPNAAPAPGGTGKQEEREEGASCWRWLLVIVAMPFLVLFTVVGLVVWLVLLPVKIICCPIGCLIQIMADLVENVLKAPFKALLWASGKPYKKKERDVEAQHS